MAGEIAEQKESDENKQSAEPSALEKTQEEIEAQELQQKLLSFQLPGMPLFCLHRSAKSAGVPPLQSYTCTKKDEEAVNGSVEGNLIM